MELLMAYSSPVVIFVVLLLSTIVQSSCPKGQIKHDNEKCCRPVLHCPPNHYVMRCTRNGNCDKCTECTYDQRNIHNTSSFDIKRCTGKTCNTDAVPTSDGQCWCDRHKAFYGQNHHFCQLANVECKKGHELTDNGNCAMCENNYFKDWIGYGYCIKEINCTELGLNKIRGDLTTETVCEELEDTCTTSPRLPDTSTPSPTIVVVERTTQRPTKKTTEKDIPVTIERKTSIRKPELEKEREEQNSSITKSSMLYIMLTIVVLLVVIILGFLASYARRKCNKKYYIENNANRHYQELGHQNVQQNIHGRPLPPPVPFNGNHFPLGQCPELFGIQNGQRNNNYPGPARMPLTPATSQMSLP